MCPPTCRAARFWATKPNRHGSTYTRVGTGMTRHTTWYGLCAIAALSTSATIGQISPTWRGSPIAIGTPLCRRCGACTWPTSWTKRKGPCSATRGRSKSCTTPRSTRTRSTTWRPILSTSRSGIDCAEPWTNGCEKWATWAEWRKAKWCGSGIPMANSHRRPRRCACPFAPTAPGPSQRWKAVHSKGRCWCNSTAPRRVLLSRMP